MKDTENRPLCCISLIVPGMTYDEVTQLIGLPQEMLTFGVIVVGYRMNDGILFTVEYFSLQPRKKPSLFVFIPQIIIKQMEVG